MSRMFAVFTLLVAALAASGCEDATCDSVARHNAKLIVGELGGAAAKQSDQYVRIERDRCRERGYTVAQMACIMKTTTPAGVDHCLGQ